MKILTKRQKGIEAQRQLKNFIKNSLEPKLMEGIKNVLNDADLPREWYLKDDFLLSNFIFTNFCEEHIKKSDFSELTLKEFSEVKKQLKTLKK